MGKKYFENNLSFGIYTITCKLLLKYKNKIDCLLIDFILKDDRYFLSGSLDGKLRLWNIPDKKVTLWNEVTGPSALITTANFCRDGKLAVVGTYDGKCIFYTTEVNLMYFIGINVYFYFSYFRFLCACTHLTLKSP
jgi:WD40 repeat protein